MSEKNSNNTSKNQYKFTFPLPMCDWCGKPVNISNQLKILVCEKCYKMLAAAGCSDAEIYGNEK